MDEANELMLDFMWYIRQTDIDLTLKSYPRLRDYHKSKNAQAPVKMSGLISLVNLVALVVNKSLIAPKQPILSTIPTNLAERKTGSVVPVIRANDLTERNAYNIWRHFRERNESVEMPRFVQGFPRPFNFVYCGERRKKHDGSLA